MSFRQADRAIASEANPLHTLGPRALNAGALRIKPATGSTPPIGLQASNDLLLRLRLDLEVARLIVCQGTASPLTTACTVRLGE
jgi:hypothetical protein